MCRYVSVAVLWKQEGRLQIGANLPYSIETKVSIYNNLIEKPTSCVIDIGTGRELCTMFCGERVNAYGRNILLLILAFLLHLFCAIQTILHFYFAQDVLI